MHWSEWARHTTVADYTFLNTQLSSAKDPGSANLKSSEPGMKEMAKTTIECFF